MSDQSQSVFLKEIERPHLHSSSPMNFHAGTCRMQPEDDFTFATATLLDIVETLLPFSIWSEHSGKNTLSFSVETDLRGILQEFSCLSGISMAAVAFCGSEERSGFTSCTRMSVTSATPSNSAATSGSITPTVFHYNMHSLPYTVLLS